MSDKTSFQMQYCRGHLIYNSIKNDITVFGTIDDNVRQNTIYYIAATPADHRATFTGSGLPFANQTQAFDNTPNKGKLTLESGNSFQIKLMTPGSYMVGLGSMTIPPTLYILYENNNGDSRTITIKLSDGIPFRGLTYPMQRSGPEFHNTQFKLYPLDQWKQLVLSGYPQSNKIPEDYWGYKPPM